MVLRVGAVTVSLAAAVLALLAATVPAHGDPQTTFRGASGTLRTLAASGAIDRRNKFFQPLGKQFAATCEHCHFAADGWSVSGEHIRQLFTSSRGKHPIFTAPSANDFHAALALKPNAPVDERRAAYGLLIDKGVALVRRNFDPVNADFDVTAVIDPSLPPSLHTTAIADDGRIVPPGAPGSTPAIPGAAYLQYTARDNDGAPQIWIHRRPLPTTNLRFLTTVSWDGQETRHSPNPATRSVRDGIIDVTKATIRGRQTGATLIAADGHRFTDQELSALATQMTDFMVSTITAQETLRNGTTLASDGATGGAGSLSTQKFYFGINDPLQGDLTVSPAGAVSVNNVSFNPVVFTLFNAWYGHRDEARAAIERGQALFNAQRLAIRGVGGLNDASITLPDGSTVTGPTALRGSCSVCHDAPNVGDHSTRLPINIGVSDKAPDRLGRGAVAGLPLFVLRRKSDGALAQTTDPGRAIISGRFAHIGQFKGPILRGLAVRPPFFHNGMAATLADVVDFYNERFKANFTPQEKADLVAFLSAL